MATRFENGRSNNRTNEHRAGNANNNNRNRNGNGNGYWLGGRGASANEQMLEILHVLFKRRRLIAALFLAVALPGLLVTLFRRPIYLAVAKVLVTTSREDPTVQPTELTRLETIRLNEAVVNSEVHIIQSRELLEQVARDLAVSETGSVVGVASAANQRNAIGQQVLALRRRLQVTPIRASNVIQIEYSASDPGRAARVVNRVVDEYLSYHALVHATKGLATFYEDQRRQLEKKLRTAEEAFQEFSFREGLAAPREEIQARVTTIAQLEQRQREVDASIAGTEEKLRVVRQQLGSQPPLVKRAEVVEVSPVVKQLTEHLVERQVDRVALLRKYTEKDRHVRDNSEEIAELQAKLEAELRDRPTVVAVQSMRSNPVYDQLLSALLDLEAGLREQRVRKLLLEEDVSRSRRQLLVLKRKALDFDRLDQEVKARRGTLDAYEKREQEARVTEAMDREKLVNVEIVQRPALPLPRTDRRGPSVMLAVFSGLAVGLGGAFGVEYLNRTLRFERDVERYLGLPVLGAVADTAQG